MSKLTLDSDKNTKNFWCALMNFLRAHQDLTSKHQKVIYVYLVSVLQAQNAPPDANKLSTNLFKNTDVTIKFIEKLRGLEKKGTRKL